MFRYSFNQSINQSLTNYWINACVFFLQETDFMQIVIKILHFYAIDFYDVINIFYDVLSKGPVLGE